MGSFARYAGYGSILILARLAVAQSGIITTVAGISPVNAPPVRGFSGDGGPAISAALALANFQNDCDPNQFEQTSHISIDRAGNLYIADSDNQRIRQLTPDQVITTVAGNGARPETNSRCEPTGSVGDGGRATDARLFNPSDAIADANGNLIIADQQNNRIRRVSPTGLITTIAGSGLHNFFAPGIPATSSPMDWPSALALDTSGLIYFAELHGNRVGRIDADNRLSVIAGTGFPGFNGDNISATTATLRKPAGIAFDVGGNLLIADTGNHRVRKVSGGVITTIAGTGRADYCGDGGPAAQACLNTPMDVKADALGNIYIADTANHRVRRIDSSGNITTIAGTGEPGRGPDGVAQTASQLNFPSALALDSNNDLYIVDWQNYLVRKVSFGPVVSPGGVVNAASFTAPVAPGSLISVFGANLASSTEAALTVPLPTTLGAISVQVNGAAIPLLAVTPGQINAQLPFEAQPGTATVVVISAGHASAPLNFTVAAAAPGLFQFPATQRAIVLNQDGSLNAPSNPETRNRVIVCFLTGIGPVDPPVATGQSAPLDTLSHARGGASATIGGAQAQIQFLGLTPGFVGLGQANILIPDGAPFGSEVPVVIEMSGQKSSPAMISIR